MNQKITDKALQIVEEALVNSNFSEEKRAFIRSYIQLFVVAYKHEWNKHLKELKND